MPNSPSAKKALRQNAVRNGRNKGRRSSMRTQLKKALGALSSGNPTAALPLVRAAEGSLDKNAQNGILHKNAAARRKSRLVRKYNALLAKQQ